MLRVGEIDKINSSRKMTGKSTCELGALKSSYYNYYRVKNHLYLLNKKSLKLYNYKIKMVYNYEFYFIKDDLIDPNTAFIQNVDNFLFYIYFNYLDINENYINERKKF